jgi:hypothetical protein
MVCLCAWLPAFTRAQNPSLFVTGLPCPGGLGEPTNAHPIVWQCLAATDSQPHPWPGWQNTARAGYGDVLSASWYNECLRHSADWDCARLDLVFTNGSGSVETNSSTIRMRAGYNFLVTYVYWYTNGSSLIPTNFMVAESPILIKTNLSVLLGEPLSIQGTMIDPPLWSEAGIAVTNASAWPPWGHLSDGYPNWPPWRTNADGALVIVPSAQLPVCNLSLATNGNFSLALQALPGAYTIQTKMDLSDSWSNQANVEVKSDGTASLEMAANLGTNLFLRAQGASPLGGIGFTTAFDTIGGNFSPAIYCSNAPPDQLMWKWSDGTTSSDFPISIKDFGSPAARTQHLTVLPATAITAINLGFDASDGGETTPLSDRPSQGVGAVHFPYPLTALRYWASSYNPITNTLDFTGFSSLEAIECFHCTNLPGVVMSNLPSLKRVCFENCDLQEMILTGNPNLEDVRAALNSYTNIVLGAGTGPKIWHFCTRDNEQLTQDLQEIMTNFYSLREPWIWHDSQSGALHFVSTNLTDVEFQDNQYSFADFSHQPNLQILWAYDNLLTNLVLTGCDSLQDLEAQNNLLTGLALDSILAALDASATNLIVANLTQNPGSPSAIGYMHYANLTNRGALVYLDFSGTNPPPVMFDSMSLEAESCAPTNNAIDPAETVAVTFAFKNIGLQDTSDLVVTLLASNGVLAPSSAQDYGVLIAGGPAVGRTFNFTANGSCGDSALATFQLQDGPNDLGTIGVPFNLGLVTMVLTEAFDSVSAPALPAGWSSSTSGGQFAWRTTTASPDNGLNAASSPDPPNIGVNELVSAPIVLPATPARLIFRNSFDLEPGDGPGIANDGGVLEIKIGANAFMDIIAAGGSFGSGGYTGTITNIWGNPLSGREAWSGNSGGYITTSVNLPAAAAGQTIQLRWRCGTDNGNDLGPYAGWRIDTLRIETAECCSSGR